MTTNDTSEAPDLAAIEARLSRATEGPWAYEHCGEGLYCIGLTHPPVNGRIEDVYNEDRREYEGKPDVVEFVAELARENAGDDARFIAAARTDVPALVARVRDLTAKLDASAQAFDALVAQVWRATGETHEPPADVVALLERVAGLRESHCERGEALSAMARRAVAAERLLDATEGTEREEELARQIRAEASARVAAARREADQSAQKARDLAGRLYAAEGEVRLLRERCASERREGAIAMRDRIARAADEHGFGDVVRGVRLPPVDASGEGAEAMRQAYATGRTDGAATMRDAAARRAAEKGRMYAGACTNVGDDIAAAIRALPLPEAP